MSAFIARQPNGKLCRFSTVVDTITHYNITDEDYIEYCAELAREAAKFRLKNAEHFLLSFDEVIKQFIPREQSSESFLKMLREMGDTETKLEDLNEWTEEE